MLDQFKAELAEAQFQIGLIQRVAPAILDAAALVDRAVAVESHAQRAAGAGGQIDHPRDLREAADAGQDTGGAGLGQGLKALCHGRLQQLPLGGAGGDEFIQFRVKGQHLLQGATAAIADLAALRAAPGLEDRAARPAPLPAPAGRIQPRWGYRARGTAGTGGAPVSAR